jgi:hypothetical protein
MAFFTALRSAVAQAPLYVRDGTEILVLLTVPDRMRTGAHADRAPHRAPRDAH